MCKGEKRAEGGDGGVRGRRECKGNRRERKWKKNRSQEGEKIM